MVVVVVVVVVVAVVVVVLLVLVVVVVTLAIVVIFVVLTHIVSPAFSMMVAAVMVAVQSHFWYQTAAHRSRLPPILTRTNNTSFNTHTLIIIQTLFDRCVDANSLVSGLETQEEAITRNRRVTPKMFAHSIRSKCLRSPQHIVLPEVRECGGCMCMCTQHVPCVYDESLSLDFLWVMQLCVALGDVRVSDYLMK